MGVKASGRHAQATGSFKSAGHRCRNKSEIPRTNSHMLAGLMHPLLEGLHLLFNLALDSTRAEHDEAHVGSNFMLNTWPSLGRLLTRCFTLSAYAWLSRCIIAARLRS